ncbi:MAG: hypothetical protein ACI4N6_04235 [Eubacteriales bacterium]
MKRTTLETIKSLRYELTHIVEQEATNLYRLARKAEQHNVKQSVIDKIREEANYLHTTLTAYPERILEWDFEYNTKYAFR